MPFESELLAALEPFRKEDLIGDVLHVVKSGKEATVYCCQALPSTGLELVAAKIYRSREHRDFKDDSLYQAGRHYGSSARRAIAARNRFGLAAMYDAWIAHEFATLHRLHAAGCDVPRPISRHGSALLLEYIGDERGAAPPLARVRLAPREARPLLDRLLHNVGLLLACDRVHGDLSPYNVLYRAGDVVIIDFPQAVQPQTNPHAYELLLRDVEQLCRYFERYGVRTQPRRIADDLWLRFQFGEL